jgi:hypothetical protein
MSDNTKRRSGTGGVLLDPTSERSAGTRPRLRRIDALRGRTVALLDISKPRGDLFLDRIAQRLTDSGATVKRFRKPTFTKPAPIALRKEIAASCDAVIEALAD